jgi:hypothetical protein
MVRAIVSVKSMTRITVRIKFMLSLGVEQGFCPNVRDL